MVTQEKLKCRSCGTALVNIVITEATLDVSKIQAKCWKCSDSSFVRTFNGKYSVVQTTKSDISHMRIEDDRMVVYTSKKETENVK